MTLREAQQIAHGLIQSYIEPDHKVMDMRAFFSALVQALRRSRAFCGSLEAPAGPPLEVSRRLRA